MKTKIRHVLALILIGLGLCRPLLFILENVFENDPSTHIKFKHLSLSPLPLVFDKSYYFAERTITFWDKDFNNRISTEKSLEEKKYKPWHIRVIYRHTLLYLAFKKPELFQVVAKDLFCKINKKNITKIKFKWNFDHLNKHIKNKRENYQVIVTCMN